MGFKAKTFLSYLFLVVVYLSLIDLHALIVP